jgi:hypothetical protein
MRKENEGSMFEHACREATHGRFGLDVEVSKHFIAAPPADQADDIGINVGAQEGHSTGGPKGTC